MLPSGNEKNTRIELQFWQIDHFTVTQSLNDAITRLHFDEHWKVASGEGQVWEPILNRIKTIVSKHPELSLATEYSHTPPVINILLINSLCLSDSRFFDEFGTTVLRSVAPKHTRQHSEAFFNNPIISISHKDISFPDAHKENSVQQFTHFQALDHRVRFLDSSIWHRYVPEFPNPLTKEDFSGCFEATLMDIIGCWKEGLYYTVSAVSALEFNLRLLRESYIGKFGGYGHHSVVTPFKFHSERYMKFLNEKEDGVIAYLDRKWSGKSLLQSVNWHFLIIDDNCCKPLSTIQKDYLCSKSKLDLLKKPLKKVLHNASITDELFKFKHPKEYHDVIGQSLKYLSEESFDMIFLDYLLSPKSEHSKERQLGHELLELLISDNKDQPAYKRDFLGKFWIFPISSFPYALNDHLQQIGISPLHSIWNLSNGGDPVTTPHLYAYYLFRFMKQKIREVFLDEVTLTQIIKEVPFDTSADQIKSWASYLHNSFSRYENLFSIMRIHHGKSNSLKFSKSILQFAEEKTKIIEVVAKLRRLTGVLVEKSGINKYKIQDARKYLESVDFQHFQFPIQLFFEAIQQCPEEINLAELKVANLTVITDERDEKFNVELYKRLNNLSRNYHLKIWYKTDPGANKSETLAQQVEEAHIQIFLLSPDFFDNVVLYKIWEQANWSWHSTSKTTFPIMIRPTNLDELSNKISIVCKETPVNYPENDSAWLTIVEKLREQLNQVFPGIKKTI
jgi:hypothetical protein